MLSLSPNISASNFKTEKKLLVVLDTLQRWILWGERLPQEIWTDAEQKQFWGVMA